MSFKHAVFLISLFSLLLNIQCGQNTEIAQNLDDALLNEYMQAKADYLHGYLSEAESGFRNVVNKRSDFYQARFMLGKTIFLRDNLEEAEKIFQDLRAQYPMYHEAQIWLVRTYISSDKIDEAYTLLKNLLSFDSSDPRLLVLLSQINKENKNYDTAIENLREALLYQEELAQAHLELARIFFQFGMYDRALVELEACKFMLSKESILYKPVINLIEKINNKEVAYESKTGND